MSFDNPQEVETRGFWPGILIKIRSNEAASGIILAIIVGVAAGFGALLFWRAIEFSSILFFREGASVFAPLGKYYVVLIPALGGLILGPIIYFFAREAKGEGPPDVMEAVAVRGGRIRPRVALLKVLASSICIGSGGSVGREGPIVQIGASVGSTIGQRLHLSDEWVKTLVLCGAAGGISATFNAPLAGIIFAVEVIAGRFMLPGFGYIVISSVAANVIARIFLFTGEHQTSFVVPQYAVVSWWEMLPYALLGVITAFAAVAFVKFFYKTESFIGRIKIPEYLKPAAGGLIIGVIGLYYPEIFGVGYGAHYGPGGALVHFGAVDQVLAGEMGLSLLLTILVLKMIATSVTLGSGGSGGVFAPSLFIGAMIGGAFGIVVHNLFPSMTAAPGAYALVGMGAFFATVVRGPITAIIILFEITRDYALILPLMLAVIIGIIIARQFNPESVYTLRLLKRGINTRVFGESSPLKRIMANQVMARDFPTVLPTTSVSTLVDKLRKTGHHGLPVVDRHGNLQGMVTLTDVERGMAEGNPKDLTVDDIASKSLVTAYPGQSLHDVLFQLGAREVGRIPVVDRDNPKKMLGVLRRQDIVRAYTKAMAAEKHKINPGLSGGH